METSAQSTGEQSAAMRLLLACGVIAPLLNSVVILILGAIRPGYNAWIVPDSNLELGMVGGSKVPTTSSLERSCSLLPSG
ncbi:hypothetical protein [Ktedonospora formicarum]|uniref:Uncharacterized protein n=1 Tax=Ktedonospora formicarum TaxID=2778364 RepID=A0A8J3IEX6_9CHLR|nr:hypothetical protein [Ktedonospora formicarum]GHO49974.1 hypothetical protein KSX_81370 [Ktedonospora formicarum]